MKSIYFIFITICFLINETINSIKLFSNENILIEAKLKKAVLFLSIKNGEQKWSWKGDPIDDSIYVGEIKNGLPHGIGTINFGKGEWNGGEKYIGQWDNGKFHRQGTFTWTNGQEYKGEFKFGEKDGLGTLVFSNGNKYEGEFKFGKYNGKGEFTFKKGALKIEKYEGNWKNGKYNGIGLYIYSHGDRYIGEFKDYKKHGHGKYNWYKGKEYIGEFKKDLISGFGILTNPDGSMFIGEYKDGINWEGTMYSEKGSVIWKIVNGNKE